MLSQAAIAQTLWRFQLQTFDVDRFHFDDSPQKHELEHFTVYVPMNWVHETPKKE